MVILEGPFGHLRDMPRMALSGLGVVSHLLHGINGFAMSIPGVEGHLNKCSRSDQYEGLRDTPKMTHLGHGVVQDLQPSPNQ